MDTFIIQTHGRLHEWVADEKGYFTDEGLDYEFRTLMPARWSCEKTTDEAPEEVKSGAFESMEAGRPVSISSACHWTTNMAASAGHGQLWPEAYAVTPAGIYVPPESDITEPEHLADVEVAVGYHSGSHYSTVQHLERFLEPEQIKLRFGGLLHDRLDLLIDRKIAAASCFGSTLYLLQQLGFQKIVDTSYMKANLVSPDADYEGVRKYFRALKRAQADIDLRPELYTHYHLKEMPAKYHDIADVRTFGPGDRIVFDSYSREIFESTHEWILERSFFPEDEQDVFRGGYEKSVAVVS
jgi:hypothetical protein